MFANNVISLENYSHKYTDIEKECPHSKFIVYINFKVELLMKKNEDNNKQYDVYYPGLNSNKKYDVDSLFTKFNHENVRAIFVPCRLYSHVLALTLATLKQFK